MSTNDFIPEAGTLPSRIEYVRETSRGETPSDPAWNIYSDHVNNYWGWEPDANKQEVQSVGSLSPTITDAGSETHEATISYWLQDWVVDGSGNAVDASGDVLQTTSDNTVNNTHSVVSRFDISTNGADGAGYRIYHVGKGGVPTEVTIPFEVDEGTPVAPELSYQFEKFRAYRIDQPSSSTTLEIDNQGTTSVDVTIEDEGAATTETNTVSGGNSVTTTATFGDIDAVELDTDTDGDVVISDGGGTTFMTIQGSDSYTTEGDLGVPALGSGSHASANNSDYVIFNDDTYDYDGTEIEDEIISGELSVSLEVEDNAVVGTSRRNIHITGFMATWTATVAGESPSVDQTVDYLTNVEYSKIKWTADEGSIAGDDVELMSPGESSYEAGQGKATRDLEWMTQSGLTLSN